MMRRWSWLVLGLFALPFPLSAQTAETELRIIDAGRNPLEIAALAEALAGQRVVFIGESHDRYDHHLAQLEIIRLLQERSGESWAIGVEFFQRSFQPYLDAYTAGLLEERELLQQTEYFERWGYDYRLYRPILRYAREHRIPLVALNVERELIDRVSAAGLDGLSESVRRQLPLEIDKSDGDYRARLQRVFAQHAGDADFERFFEVQLVWDESMAQQAADYLTANPSRRMIVLAGSGHIAFGSGIPSRLERRLSTDRTVILLPADTAEADLQGADYLLVSSHLGLPPAGRIGVVMAADESGAGVRAREVAPGGAAASSGMEVGDVIVAIADAAIASLSDLRIALLDMEPGRSVSVRVRRGQEELSFDVTLQ